MHSKTSYVTLTYNDANLPLDGSVDVSHWQLFAKRLRKEKGPFRFFHCGEYGDENKRPHYHALIFGHDFREDRKPHIKNAQGDMLDSSEELERIWGKGFCLVGNVSHQSAAYVARYVMKKINGPLQDYHYVDTETGLIRHPEYTTMSRRPGIGRSWIEKFYSDVYPRDEVISNGKSTRPPSFYDRYCEEVDPALMQTIRSQRKFAGSKHADDQTPERLTTREIVLAAKTQQLKRNL